MDEVDLVLANQTADFTVGLELQMALPAVRTVLRPPIWSLSEHIAPRYVRVAPGAWLRLRSSDLRPGV